MNAATRYWTGRNGAHDLGTGASRAVICDASLFLNEFVHIFIIGTGTGVPLHYLRGPRTCTPMNMTLSFFAC